jgi:flavodoxin short chain
MKKISVVYWSGTGNTEKMAIAIKDGAEAAGASCTCISADSASVEDVASSDSIALGCPAMGSEVLEESIMEPFITEIEKRNLSGKNLALFGSYDWGDGEWMRNWVSRMKKTGASILGEGLIIQNDPDEEALSSCRTAGKLLAQ